MGKSSLQGNWQADQSQANSLQVFLTKIREAKVINVSQGGLALKTTIPLIMGQDYVFLVRAGVRKVFMEGEVVRCSLDELRDTDMGRQEALYANGVKFHLDRGTQEINLIHLVKSGVSGERRLGGPRVAVPTGTSADVAIPAFPNLIEVTNAGILGDCLFSRDAREGWPLLVKAGHQCFHVFCRQLDASAAKNGLVRTQLEFLNLRRENLQILREFLSPRQGPPETWPSANESPGGE